MLGKKGFSLPSHWMLFMVGLVLMVLALIFVSYINASRDYSVEAAKSILSTDNQDVEAIDIQFMNTDLLNILKLSITEDYTFGELLSYTERNYPSKTDDFLFNDLFTQYSSERLGCDETLFDALDAQLRPVYEDNWYLTVRDDSNELIFFCTPIEIDLFPLEYGFTEAIIPSQDHTKNIKVTLEVYE